jgi:hypothetical protein
MPEVIDLSKPQCADRIVSRESGKSWGAGEYKRILDGFAYFTQEVEGVASRG